MGSALCCGGQGDLWELQGERVQGVGGVIGGLGLGVRD